MPALDSLNAHTSATQKKIYIILRCKVDASATGLSVAALGVTTMMQRYRQELWTPWFPTVTNFLPAKKFDISEPDSINTNLFWALAAGKTQTHCLIVHRFSSIYIYIYIYTLRYIYIYIHTYVYKCIDMNPTAFEPESWHLVLQCPLWDREVWIHEDILWLGRFNLIRQTTAHFKRWQSSLGATCYALGAAFVPGTKCSGLTSCTTDVGGNRVGCQPNRSKIEV